ncbi:MAG: hypothetical protein ABIH67_00470 [Candidatus Uhrbacteria bacterium]
MSLLKRLVDWEKVHIVAGEIRDSCSTVEEQTWLTRFMIKSLLIEWLLGLAMLICMFYSMPKLAGEFVDWPALIICFAGFVLLLLWTNWVTHNIEILFYCIDRWHWATSLYPILAFCCVTLLVLAIN